MKKKINSLNEALPKSKQKKNFEYEERAHL